MIQSIGTTNPIQRFNAMSAFKMMDNVKNATPQVQDISDGIDTNEQDILKDKDVNDIQKYAKIAGENLSEDDIKYGVTYGRSVIAEYLA